MADNEYESVPEAQVPQVAQLLSEKANAEALGQTDRVEAMDKALDELGYKGKAAEKRKAAAEDNPEAKSEPPKERSSKKQDTTDK
jgi:hypothetical protein